MLFKTVSTLAMTDGPDALDAAISCAERWSAHLNVTCISHASVAAEAFAYPEMGMAQAVMTHNIAEALDKAETQVRAKLAAQDFGWSVTAVADTRPDMMRDMTRSERFSDLMILPSPRTAPAAAQIISAVLNDMHLPILVAPEGTLEEPSFKTIMIAWDESDVALAAVRAALPLLAEADRIEIVAVDPASENSGNDLAVMLDRKGIDADVTTVPLGGKAIADVMLDHARETGAELIVMGAYGHRRLRDVLLGGVTKQVLGKSPVPLLIAR